MSKSKTIVEKTCCFAKNVVKKTQELFELSQINVKIMQLKNKLERKYVTIGYCIYNKQKKDGMESLKESMGNKKLKTVFCEIDMLRSDLKKLEEELKEIKKCLKKEGNCVMGCCESNSKSNDGSVEITRQKFEQISDSF